MPGGGRLTIDIGNAVDAAYAHARPGLEPGRFTRLRVSDTGAGMDREAVARAFEPFYTTKPAGQGTGLGLATVYGIVTQAGGYVHIYSEPGLGTTVSALLPATEDAATAAGPKAAAPDPGNGETILVVEDEQSLRDMACRILERNGYLTCAATSASNAIRLASDLAQPIDLLLTDVVMPEMLGNEVAARVGAIRPGAHVLYMSGYAQTVLGAEGALNPDVDLLEKPFSEATLLTCVRQAIDRPAPGGAPIGH
jgi:two-component system, cell cycle sensor histidine kinase and response regulator CckA